MDGGERAQGIPTDSDVEDVVQQLRAIDHDSAWARIVEVGRVVFEGIVRGDETQWRSRRSTKNLSLRRLVEHPACPFKKTALGDAVNVHLFVKRNPSIAELTSLSPTHVMRVVGLPNDQALQLLHKAAEGAWTVRELGLEVQAQRKQSGERRGRPMSPAERKAETLARRAATALRAMHLHLTQCRPLDERHASSLLTTLDEILDLASEARSLPVVGRKSGIVLSLAKAPLPIDERKEVVG